MIEMIDGIYNGDPEDLTYTFYLPEKKPTQISQLIKKEKVATIRGKKLEAERPFQRDHKYKII